MVIKNLILVLILMKRLNYIILKGILKKALDYLSRFCENLICIIELKYLIFVI